MFNICLPFCKSYVLFYHIEHERAYSYVVYKTNCFNFERVIGLYQKSSCKFAMIWDNYFRNIPFIFTEKKINQRKTTYL